MVGRSQTASSPAPIMRVSGIFELVQWLTENGRSVDPLLKASGLMSFDLSNPNGIVPLIPASAFYKLVLDQEGADIGVRVVNSGSLSRIGGVGKLLLRGPTIREGLYALAVAFAKQATHAHLTVTPENGHIDIRHFFSMALSAEALHLVQQFNAALLLSLCQMAKAPEPWLVSLEITPHPRLGIEHLRPYFGDVLRPSKTGALLARMSRKVVDKPYNLLTPITDTSAPSWNSLRGSGGFPESVQLILRSLLAEGEPTIKQVSAICGLSVRTFQRRLAVEGTTFAAVLDTVRKDVVIELLDKDNHRIGEVGSAAGYRFPSALSRAVRRWTGKTPRNVRQQ